MSAFMVCKTHIDSLVQAGIEAELIHPDKADEFGRMLWAENLASIHYRYPDTLEGGQYPGPLDFRAEHVEQYTYEPLNGAAGLSRVAREVVHGAARCYDYQSCEHPEYEKSQASKFIALLIGLVACKGGHNAWEVNDRDAFIDAAIA